MHASAPSRPMGCAHAKVFVRVCVLLQTELKLRDSSLKDITGFVLATGDYNKGAHVCSYPLALTLT